MIENSSGADKLTGVGQTPSQRGSEVRPDVLAVLQTFLTSLPAGRLALAAAGFSGVMAWQPAGGGFGAVLCISLLVGGGAYLIQRRSLREFALRIKAEQAMQEAHHIAEEANRKLMEASQQWKVSTDQANERAASAA